MAWVDAAKGISILLVVAHHTLWFLASTDQAPAVLVAANEALASLRMPLFFLASGLFVAGPLAAPWRTLLHKRVAFFLYLYLLWTVIRFAFFLAFPDVVDPYNSADPMKLALALLLPGSGMWFLYALALYSIIGKLIRPVPVWLQLAASGALSALAGAEIISFESGPWTRIVRYLFFFLLGWHMPALIHRIARASSALKVAAGAGACAVAAAVTVALDMRSVPGVAFALNVLAVIFGILFAAWIARYTIGQPLVVLGRQTLPVYLIHVLWLAAFMAGVRHIDLTPAVAYTLPVVMTIALTALSLLTHRAIVYARGAALFRLPSRFAYRAPARPKPVLKWA